MAEIQHIIELTFTEADASAFAASALESANNAANSATTAFQHASNAGSSADNASNYAFNAESYAHDAETFAANASNYSDLAQTKANEAADSATTAVNAKNDAERFAREANQDSDIAAGSVLMAQEAANKASTAASNASNYATTATAKANEASQSASDAAVSANGASTFAVQAYDSATQASASATNASTSANNAASSATTANSAADDATAAKTAAETAKTAAEQSATSAATSAQTAQQVKDSIPADYTELSDSVEDLKNAFEQLPTSIQPDMSVGNVFSDDSYTEDKTPYLYRVSGGGVEVGKVEADTIVGGSVAFNQLVLNGNFANGTTDWYPYNCTLSAMDNVLTAVANANPTPYIQFDLSVVQGHKYLELLDVFPQEQKSAVAFVNNLVKGRWENLSGNTWNRLSTITYADVTRTQAQRIYFNYSDVNNGKTTKFRNINIIDLTQMFGSAVADYLYSLETATAGAGVAFFRKMFPNAYYPYNAGELMHVSGLQSHDMVGFNAIDVSAGTDNKYMNTSGGGVEVAREGMWHSDFVRVAPNTNYYTNANGSGVDYPVLLYDMDKRYIGRITSATGDVFNTGNASYVIVQTKKSLTPVSDLVLNLSWSGAHNGEYEQYVKHSYPLDSSLTLRGIPKLDASNNLYYDGDVYSADGTVQRKFGVITLNGSETWTAAGSTGVNGFYTTVNNLAKSLNYRGSIICNKLTTTFTNYSSEFINGQFVLSGYGDSNNSYPNQNWIYIKTTGDFNDSATIKSWLAANPITVVYELATPTEETAEPYAEYQHVTNGGTEEYVSTGIVPVGHITKYPTDIVSKVDGLPSDFSTLIAPTEKGFTATRAYSVNQFMIINNQLYKATASIANGATITVGTNVTATTIADILTSLLNA